MKNNIGETTYMNPIVAPSNDYLIKGYDYVDENTYIPEDDKSGILMLKYQIETRLKEFKHLYTTSEMTKYIHPVGAIMILPETGEAWFRSIYSSEGIVYIYKHGQLREYSLVYVRSKLDLYNSKYIRKQSEDTNVKTIK